MGTACYHHHRLSEGFELFNTQPITELLVLFSELLFACEPHLTIFFNAVRPTTQVAEIWEALKLQQSPTYMFIITLEFTTTRDFVMFIENLTCKNSHPAPSSSGSATLIVVPIILPTDSSVS